MVNKLLLRYNIKLTSIKHIFKDYSHDSGVKRDICDFVELKHIQSLHYDVDKETNFPIIIIKLLFSFINR